MMKWTVEVLNVAVEKEILALPQDIQAKLLRIIDLIESEGLEKLREPYVKHLEGKLWEMRMKGRDGIGRAIYITATGRKVVIVHAFEKTTEKTPDKALRLARQRAKEYPK